MIFESKEQELMFMNVLWLRLLFNTQIINEETFKSHCNLCGRIRRMLIAS